MGSNATVSKDDALTGEEVGVFVAEVDEQGRVCLFGAPHLGRGLVVYNPDGTLVVDLNVGFTRADNVKLRYGIAAFHSSDTRRWELFDVVQGRYLEWQRNPAALSVTPVVVDGDMWLLHRLSIGERRDAVVIASRLLRWRPRRLAAAACGDTQTDNAGGTKHRYCGGEDKQRLTALRGLTSACVRRARRRDRRGTRGAGSGRCHRDGGGGLGRGGVDEALQGHIEVDGAADENGKDNHEENVDQRTCALVHGAGKPLRSRGYRYANPCVARSGTDYSKDGSGKQGGAASRRRVYAFSAGAN